LGDGGQKREFQRPFFDRVARVGSDRLEQFKINAFGVVGPTRAERFQCWYAAASTQTSG
jgi:hypothetical protein